MTKVTIIPGPCQLKTVVETERIDRKTAGIKICTQCKNYKPLETELMQVDIFKEVLGKIGEGEIYTSCKKYSKHASCPVPSGILKAVEVGCKMALPVNASITFEKE